MIVDSPSTGGGTDECLTWGDIQAKLSRWCARMRYAAIADLGVMESSSWAKQVGQAQRKRTHDEGFIVCAPTTGLASVFGRKLTHVKKTGKPRRK